MKKLDELKELPEFVIDPKTGEKVYKPSEESTRKWLDGMGRSWQEFLRLHKEGYFPNISDNHIQRYLNGDDSVIEEIRKK